MRKWIVFTAISLGLYLILAVIISIKLPVVQENCNKCNGNRCTLMLCRKFTLSEAMQRGEISGSQLIQVIIAPITFLDSFI